jgi:hypothetical protein
VFDCHVQDVESQRAYQTVSAKAGDCYRQDRCPTACTSCALYRRLPHLQSPNMAGCLCVPKCKQQEWQDTTTTWPAAAVSCSRSQRSMRSTVDTAPMQMLQSVQFTMRASLQVKTQCRTQLFTDEKRTDMAEALGPWGTPMHCALFTPLCSHQGEFTITLSLELWQPWQVWPHTGRNAHSCLPANKPLGPGPSTPPKPTHLTGASTYT